MWSRVGMRVVFAQSFDRFPWYHIQTGERGTVVNIWPGHTRVKILMDRPHAGLAHYQNHLWLTRVEAFHMIGPLLFAGSQYLCSNECVEACLSTLPSLFCG
jgi:hypothetical protein